MHERDKIKFFRWHNVTRKRIETNLSFFMKPFTCSKSLMKTANEYVKHVRKKKKTSNVGMVPSFLKWNRFCISSDISIVDFEQVNSG